MIFQHWIPFPEAGLRFADLDGYSIAAGSTAISRSALAAYRVQRGRVFPADAVWDHPQVDAGVW